MKTQQYLIPGAIIIAGGLIAVGVLFGNNPGTGNTVATGGHGEGGGMLGGTPTAEAAGREENAYVVGNPDAPIKIVEFSDFECPFCARLHPTLARLIEESDGGIAWEYRHLPLPSHRNAEAAAYAGECIGRLGGNEAFWSFADSAFKNQRSFNETFYTSEAERLGIDLASFESCMGSSEVKEVVRADRNTAVSFGGSGTPFSVIVFPDGTTQPVSGALPYEQWAQLLTL